MKTPQDLEALSRRLEEMEEKQPLKWYAIILTGGALGAAGALLILALIKFAIRTVSR